ncbi:protein SCO1 homolog 2, mitochondrial [Ananas comosus]|uniref:Protein SCO1 homolog 2, mitochondrial n=1 Tax=Ananas comosus TaxID=4615 RepID=A0A6P5GEN4_ANACO|nr:protein SCO1 homolog 2, mitochondrial [Ananas comosus]
MLNSRLVALSLRHGLSASSWVPRPTRSYPLRSFVSRGYSNGTRRRDHNLARQLSDDNELSNSQSWIYYVIPTALLVLAGAATFIHYNDEKRVISQESKQDTITARQNINRPAIGGPFKLYDIEGNLVTESDLRGNWTLMYFGYTSCPDVGPEEVQKMADGINILESKYNIKITPIFITIDPQRDAPAQLKAYLQEFDSRIKGLTGPIDAVRQIAQEYRVFFKKVDEIGQDYLVECSHNMYLLDPNLDTVRCFGVEYDASQLSDAIMAEVRKASK